MTSSGFGGATGNPTNERGSGVPSAQVPDRLINKPQKRDNYSIARYLENSDGTPNTTITEEQIKSLIEQEVEKNIDRLAEYYHKKYPTFDITGGHDLVKHDLSEYQMSTKSAQTILFTNTGNAKILGNASVEVISNGKKSGGGGFDPKGEAGIVLYAKDGIIHIESANGTVFVKAAKDINLQAGGDIKLDATGNIDIKAGKDMITNVDVDSSENVQGSKLVYADGGLTLHSEKHDIETSSGTDEALYSDHPDLKTEWDTISKLRED